MFFDSITPSGLEASAFKCSGGDGKCENISLHVQIDKDGFTGKALCDNHFINESPKLFSKYEEDQKVFKLAQSTIIDFINSFDSYNANISLADDEVDIYKKHVQTITELLSSIVRGLSSENETI